MEKKKKMKSGKRILLLLAIIAFTIIILVNGSSILKLINYDQQSSLNNKTTAQATIPSSNKSADKEALQKQQDDFQSDNLDLPDFSTAESAKISKWIVIAKLKSTEARKLPDTTVFTFSDFEVLQSIKGDYPEKTVTLRTYGGRVDDIVVTEFVQFNFIKNERYFLFLGDKNAAGYPTIDPNNIFIIKTDSGTAAEYISPNPRDLPIYEAKTEKPYKANQTPVSVEDFIFSLRKFNKLNQSDNRK
jgi:hypothetical protein